MAYPTDADNFTDTTGAEVLGTASGGIGVSALFNLHNAAIEAIEAKMGTGASTPASGKVLRSTGASVSSWGQVDVTTDVAAFTSANLRTLLSDETGTGAAVFATSPTLVTPTIADLTNAQHDHSDADDGGVLGNEVVTNAMLAHNAAWTDYTPTFTNLTVGNGILTGDYQQIGKTVRFRIRLIFGTTTSIAGNVDVSVPVTGASHGASATTFQAIATGTILDASTGAVYPVSAGLVSTTVMRVLPVNAASTYANWVSMTSTIPFTWATSDELFLTGSYEAA